MIIDREVKVTYRLVLSGDEAQELYDALNGGYDTNHPTDHPCRRLFERLYDDGYRTAPVEKDNE